MKKVLTFAVLLVVASAAAYAQCTNGAACNGGAAPEIDANTAASAVALLSGALMMLRRKR